MEEKKLDLNSIIGFVLIFGIKIFVRSNVGWIAYNLRKDNIEAVDFNVGKRTNNAQLILKLRNHTLKVNFYDKWSLLKDRKIKDCVGNFKGNISEIMSIISIHI